MPTAFLDMPGNVLEKSLTIRPPDQVLQYAALNAALSDAVGDGKLDSARRELAISRGIRVPA
jgi:hypothetical protein